MYVSIWSPLAEAFNSLPLHSYHKRKKVGLFGISDLHVPEDFDHLKQKCVVKIDHLIQEALSKTRNRKMVEIFDDMSDSLCKVADVAEFIRLAHPQHEYCIAAENACSTVSGIVEKLNTNIDLYNVLKEAVTKNDVVPVTKTDTRVGNLFLVDFEQCGIHLPEGDRSTVVKLTDAILNLGQRFVAGTFDSRAVKKMLLPVNLRNVFESDGDNIIVSGLHSDSADSSIREIAYKIFLSPDPAQDVILNKLLEFRYELAKICGFPTYADRALRGSILDKPDKVMSFLKKISVDIWDSANDDFQIMKKMKMAESNSALNHWDVNYFTQKAKKQFYKVSSKEYSPYFSLGACMDGLNFLFKQIYNIQLVNTKIENGECWASDVYKLSVIHDTEGLLGYIYCDFYERHGKPYQDCHYTIQGGRKLSNGEYQIPKVVVMLNLPLPKWSSPSLLTPTMVDNLFHEMGHAMHSMLARTTYQHVSGTRCSTDFAEVPSILMEYFASDQRVLKQFARHFQTQEPISDDMLNRLCASKRLFNPSETQLQIFYAAVDQAYHRQYPLEGSTTEILANIQNNFYCLPYVKNTAWQLRFSHLVGYGSKYYSYLVSRAVAFSIWQKYFEQDPFNSSSGEKYRVECLGHGGEKDPKLLVADFLQFDPQPNVVADFLKKEIAYYQDQVKMAVVN